QGCELAGCGDGFVYEGVEVCDDNNDVDEDECTNACTTAVCGDGIVQDGVEECDDGNQNEDDGCNNQCEALADPQCFLPYIQLTRSDRNITQNDGNGGIEFCDQNANDGEWAGLNWYRFTGQAGTQMPTTAPVIYACGTDAPGWLNGSHPSFADGVVARQVCFNWSGNQCNWNSQIQVVACPGYYLYQLPNSPVCALRYCGVTP
ncbi:MAG: DUF4215 domain-containing protein, partial [Myxococcales bacterium]|nr:DUF4215 domain-containing protein [Myxococcales bacterium]